mmetsp:Transcript_109575/g.309119  ORF Transcript_109575/g.309119 Transcript_109575/m.309119 type:complete len:201 (+) Transcript_109575:573-1175(+)
MLEVGIAFKRLQAENAILGRRATHREGVTHDGPLFERAVAGDFWKREDLADVMEEPNEVEPIVVGPLLADAFRRLEVVDAVREVVVRIGIVHEVVQQPNHLHYGELAFVEPEPILPLPLAKSHGLVPMHCVVSQLNDVLALRVLVIAEAVSEGVHLRFPILQFVRRLVDFDRHLFVRGRLAKRTIGRAFNVGRLALEVPL